MLVGLTFTTEPFLWGCLTHGSHLPFTDREMHVFYTLTFYSLFTDIYTGQWASDSHWSYPCGLWGGEICSKRGSIKGENEEEEEDVLFPGWLLNTFC